MRIRQDRKPDSKVKSAAQESASNRRGNQQVSAFTDNRASAVTQRQLQQKADTATPGAAARSSATAANRTGMPDRLKSGLEKLSGQNLSDVRVHYNSDKPAALNALAYAQAPDIHLGPGQEKHLPHEGWHVVQQKQGRVKPTAQAKSTAINDDQGLEAEATLMGEKALQAGSRSEPQNDSKTPIPAGSSATAGTRPPLQGKFGLEVELPILASARRHGDNDYVNAEAGKTKAVLLADGDGFKVHLDHRKSMKPHGTIIELVTHKPIDEYSMSKADAAKQTGKMAAAAKDMAANAKKNPPKKLSEIANVNTVRKKRGWDLYAGHPRGQGQSDKGYVQVTFGIQLASVPDALRRSAQEDIREKSQDSTRFTSAASGAERLVNEIRQKMNLPKNSETDSEDARPSTSAPPMVDVELEIDPAPPAELEQDIELSATEPETSDTEQEPTTLGNAPPAPPPMTPELEGPSEKPSSIQAPERAPDALNVDLANLSGDQGRLRRTNYKNILRKLGAYRKALAQGKAGTDKGRKKLAEIATDIRDRCHRYVSAHENDKKLNKNLAEYSKKVPEKQETRVFWVRRLGQQADAAITRLGSTSAGAKGIESSREDVDSLQPLAGLFAFLLNYLIAGKQKMKSNRLLKNAVGQFYAKASLASIAASMGGSAGAALMDKTWRNYIKNRLLELADRKPGESMFPEKRKGKPMMALSCENYLEGVLSGRADPLFSRSVNPWSPELRDRIGPAGEEQEALVIENRRAAPADKKTSVLDAIRERKGETGKGMAPDEWVDLTEKYYDLLHEIHKTKGS